MQVHGTLASGKSSSYWSLHHTLYARYKGTDTTVYPLSGWPKTDLGQLDEAGRWRKKRFLKQTREDDVSDVLFDDAQDSYWDADLWNFALKTVSGTSTNDRIILFCGYGNPTRYPNLYEGGTRFVVPPDAQVSLRPQPRSDIGLLMTAFDHADLEPHWDGINVDEGLKTVIYDATNRHVGMVISYLRFNRIGHEAPMRDNWTFTLDQFNSIYPPLTQPTAHLMSSSAGRGLPLKMDIQDGADIFRQLLSDNKITVLKAL
ncbi:hypothetical protein FRB97_008197 [Tulasnella sp. 331]|nr:hypothetical protein FRB97_008197 [Tulasnella sp. 331]